MASSLIEHKRINTTVAKAKALRVYIEPLITKSKDDTTHSRRVVFSQLKNKQAVTELFREVAVKVGNRPGGYTRIIRTGNRLGDNAEMCLIELVDFNELYSANEPTKKKRSRRGGKKTTEASAAVEAAPAVESTMEVSEETPEVKAEESPSEEPKKEDNKDEKTGE